jgi:hypothetical protein
MNRINDQGDHDQHDQMMDATTIDDHVINHDLIVINQ